jgi:hypothetical protein
MTTLMDLRRAIDAGLGSGESLATVEEEIIEPSPLSDDEKSALWLYAWSLADVEGRTAGPAS